MLTKTSAVQVAVIHQEEIRPDGKWQWRWCGDHRWSTTTTRPANCTLYRKKGRFYVYIDTITGIEYAYRY